MNEVEFLRLANRMGLKIGAPTASFPRMSALEPAGIFDEARIPDGSGLSDACAAQHESVLPS